MPFFFFLVSRLDTTLHSSCGSRKRKGEVKESISTSVREMIMERSTATLVLELIGAGIPPRDKIERANTRGPTEMQVQVGEAFLLLRGRVKWQSSPDEMGLDRFDLEYR